MERRCDAGLDPAGLTDLSPDSMVAARDRGDDRPDGQIDAERLLVIC
jgi:hypothetical protein